MSLTLPLSTLIDRGDPHAVEQLLSLAGVLEIRDHSHTIPRTHHRVIYHADASIVAPFADEQVAQLATVAKEHPDVEMVSFHVASCYDRPGIVDGRFVPAGRRLGRAEMVDMALANLLRVRQELPVNTRISVENNNYFATGAYEDVCDPVFLTELVRASDLDFLFDWAHACISAAHLSTPFDVYVSQLPLDRACQIHLSSPKSSAAGWSDAHDLPTIEDAARGAHCTAGSDAMKYITPEYYRDARVLLGWCEKLCDSAIWTMR